MDLFDPAGKGKISVRVVNTGAILDSDSFERFIQSREENLFNQYSYYSKISWNIYSSVGIASISKSFTIDKVQKIVRSSYHQFKEAMYIIDYWSDHDVYASYDPVYATFESQITYDNRLISNLKIYESDGFSFDTGYYTIPVPSFWTFSHRIGQFTVVNTFTSPDKHALVQSAVYDDGMHISIDDAASFMLILLRNYYAEDIVVISDKVLPGINERLSWYSYKGNYSGDSVFEVRGTAFILFTVLYDNNYKLYYSDRLEQVMDTYLNP